MNFNNIPSNRRAVGMSALLTNPENVNDNSNYENAGGRPVIAGLDIDWCGAQLTNSSDTGSTKTIKTTEELLTLINEMNKRLYTLTAAVIALSNK